MGVSEFSTALANFNQEQIDTIQTSVDEVQAAVNEIKNTDLADVNNKIGTSVDGSALLTLFGKLARIISDTSGLDSKLDIITAYVDGVETLLSTVNGHVDSVEGTLATIAGDVDSVEGTLATINGHVDTLESSAATINSKLDRVTAYLPKMADFVNSSASAGTWYTILNYTGGPGRLYKVYALNLNDASAGRFSEIRVTVDGVESILTGADKARKYDGASDSPEGWSYSGIIDFDSSLKVEINCSGSPNSIAGAVDYGLV